MLKHRTSEEVFSLFPEVLAARIADLRYDEQVALFRFITLKYSADAMADAERGRPQLSQKLLTLAERTGAAAETADEIWNICKEHMKESPEESSS